MKLGLVFAGGGGKGGYQIGVWKYLKEIGLDKRISVISGTSVGGLNSALISCCDYQTAEYIWTNEINDKILDSNNSTNKDGAIFSRTGLLHIIDTYVDLNILKTLRQKVYVTCFNTTDLKSEHFCLNEYEPADVKKLLCATSAIPVAFQNEEIFGKKYIDGGVKDNIPLKPLLQENCTHAIIVNLSDNHESYSGFDIYTIVINPLTMLGDFISGTLDFTLERSKTRIELGYSDCKNRYSIILKPLLGDNMTKEFEEKAMEINSMNDTQVLLETLKRISANPSLVGKIQSKWNKEMGTMGGNLLWKNIAEFCGWKFQVLLNSKHIRLLDQMNNRKAWGKYQNMIDVCKHFLLTELKDEMDAKLQYTSESASNKLD